MTRQDNLTSNNARKGGRTANRLDTFGLEPEADSILLTDPLDGECD
jgi:hypothetical protein